jgi:hypothetical protein
LHDALAEQLGQRLWEQWFAPAALIFDESGGLAVVAPTAFSRPSSKPRMPHPSRPRSPSGAASTGSGSSQTAPATAKGRREDRRVVEAGENDWCILRTQSANTLGLAAALTDSGWRAWTPTEVITRHARRAIPRKDLTVPLMPSLVFVGWCIWAK